MGREQTVAGELAGRVAAGEPNAIASLYASSAARAFGLAVRVTGETASAERAVERAFGTAAEIAKRFSDQSGMSFEAAFLESVRQCALQERPAGQSPSPMQSDEAEPSYSVAAAVRNEFAQLDPLARRVLELAFYGGLGLDSVAELVGRPASELRPLLRSALLQIGAGTRDLQETAR